jgi:hypothetical protein
MKLLSFKRACLASILIGCTAKAPLAEPALENSRETKPVTSRALISGGVHERNSLIWRLPADSQLAKKFHLAGELDVLAGKDDLILDTSKLHISDGLMPTEAALLSSRPLIAYKRDFASFEILSYELAPPINGTSAKEQEDVLVFQGLITAEIKFIYKITLFCSHRQEGRFVEEAPFTTNTIRIPILDADVKDLRIRK